jgi:hypothetical protein
MQIPVMKLPAPVPSEPMIAAAPAAEPEESLDDADVIEEAQPVAPPLPPVVAKAASKPEPPPSSSRAVASHRLPARGPVVKDEPKVVVASSRQPLEDETSRPALSAVDDDREEARPKSKGRPQVADAWSAKESEPKNKADGRKVATWVMALAIGGAIALIYARFVVRGDHDTKDGLELRPPPSASAKPTASVAVETAPSVTASVPVAASPSSSAAPSASVAVVSPTPSDVPSATPSATATHRRVAVAPASSDEISTGPPSGSGNVSNTFTEAAQRALQGQDPSSRTVAKNLAWEATRRDPTNADAWIALGQAYEALGDATAAKTAYKTCMTQAAQHPSAMKCRALAGM